MWTATTPLLLLPPPLLLLLIYRSFRRLFSVLFSFLCSIHSLPSFLPSSFPLAASSLLLHSFVLPLPVVVSRSFVAVVVRKASSRSRHPNSREEQQESRGRRRGGGRRRRRRRGLFCPGESVMRTYVGVSTLCSRGFATWATAREPPYRPGDTGGGGVYVPRYQRQGHVSFRERRNLRAREMGPFLLRFRCRLALPPSTSRGRMLNFCPRAFSMPKIHSASPCSIGNASLSIETCRKATLLLSVLEYVLRVDRKDSFETIFFYFDSTIIIDLLCNLFTLKNLLHITLFSLFNFYSFNE